MAHERLLRYFKNTQSFLKYVDPTLPAAHLTHCFRLGSMNDDAPTPNEDFLAKLGRTLAASKSTTDAVAELHATPTRTAPLSLKPYLKMIQMHVPQGAPRQVRSRVTSQGNMVTVSAF